MKPLSDDGVTMAHWSGFQPCKRVSRERRRLRLYTALMWLDAIAVVAGCGMGNLLRFGEILGPSDAPSTAFLLLPLYLVFAIGNQAYAMDVLLASRVGIVRSLASLGCAAAAVIFLGFYLKASEDFSRLAFTYATLGGGTVLVVARRLFGRLVGRLYGGTMLTVVVVQDGVGAPHVRGAIVVDAAAAALRPDIADPLAMDRIGSFLDGADRVIVACPPERRRAWAMTLKGAHVDGEIVDETVHDLGAIGTRGYGTHATIVVANGALGMRARTAKRLLDVSLAVLALLLLLPLLVVVAIAIKLDDGGEILFTQPRLGRANRLFAIYKFRSMRAAAADAAGTRSAARDDDRITRTGRLIRKTSVDELPQLLNILKGEMSFVGPRPHALGSLAGTKLFWEVDPRYWHRHNTKPGLTGLAQIRGYRGATLEEFDLVNRLQADFEYISDWTLWRDIAILLATLRVIVHRNAF